MKKICLILLILFVSLLPAKVLAQDSASSTNPLIVTSLGVDPAILETVLDPGNSLQKTIVLSNLTNLPIPIKTLKQGFDPKEIVDVPQDKLSIFDASSWIELSSDDTDFILQPKEIKTITINFNPPTDASPGGHYASLIFEPLVPEDLVSSQSVYVYARVAVLLFMEVKGDIQQQLDFKNFQMSSVYEDSPITITGTLENTGNTHLRPTGKVVITNEFTQKQVETLDITPSIILPDVSKDYSVSFEDAPSIGRFSAQIFLTYGDNNTVLTSNKVYFIVFPYKLFFVLVTILIFLYLIIFRLRKRIIKAGKILFSKEKPTDN